MSTNTPDQKTVRGPSTARLVSAGAVMASGTLLSKILGFVRVALLAYVIGNGTRQADMYALATTIPTGLYILFAGGALNTVLVPQLVRAVKNDADGGEAYTNRIITAFLLLLALATAVLTLATPLIIQIYSSGAWQAPELSEHYRSMVLLTFFCIPEVFFYGVFYLLGQVLNAKDRFGPMMWAPIANNIIQIGVLIAFLAIWGTSPGVDPFSGPQIWLLGGGHLFGILMQTLVMVVCLRQIGYRYRPRFDLKGTGLGHTFHLAKWTLGFVLVNQLALIVVTKLATAATADGSGAGLLVYNNAYLIWILPHSLITVSLATAMLPSASRLAAEGDMRGVRDEMMRTIKLANVIVLPAAVAFLALATPLATLLFGHGRGANDVSFVSMTLMAFAIGLVPFTIQYICLRAFYALEDTRITFLLQCVIATLNVVFALVLVNLLAGNERMAPTLALAYSLAYLVGVGITFRVLAGRLPGLSAVAVIRFLTRILLAVAPGAAVAWAICQWLDSSTLVLILGLALGGLIAVGSYLALARVLHIDEVTGLMNTLLRRGRGVPEVSPREKSADGDADDDETRVRPVVALDDPPTTVRATISPVQPVEPEFLGDPDDVEDADFHGTGDVEDTDDIDTEDPHSSGDSDWVYGDESTGVDTAEDEHPIRVKSGRVLGGRYRLEEILIRREETQTWRAFDEVLSRSVIIHLLPPEGDNELLLEAARKAAVATDSRFLRVLDAAVPTEADQLSVAAEPGEPDKYRIGPYIVCEYAPGESLEVILASGPLSALEAAWLVREVADALVGMHAQGLYHQRISPDTVVITAAGNIKIVGFLLEAEMAPAHQTATVHHNPEAIDVMDLGRLLYCTLVSRWPGGHAYGMAAAPSDSEGRILTPRQVRAGVSPALDQVCDRILSVTPRERATALRTAADVDAALSRVLGTADASQDLEKRMRYPVPVVAMDDEPDVVVSPGSAYVDMETAQGLPPVPLEYDEEPTGPIEDPAPRTPSDPPTGMSPLPRPDGAPRWIKVLIGLVLIVLVGSLIAVAIRMNPQAGSDDPPPAQQWPVVTAVDFDPEGADGRENTEQVPFASDGDPATAWHTMEYKEARMSKQFGPGIIFDLGEVRQVNRVDLNLVGDGTTLEVRVPAEAPESVVEPPRGSVDEWIVAARADRAPATTTVALERPTRTRFVLILFTEIPAQDAGNHVGGIAEARFWS